MVKGPNRSHPIKGVSQNNKDIVKFETVKREVLVFKTTTKLKKVEWLEKYFVQEAAYAYMYYERTGIEVDKLVTLSVAEDGQVQVEQRYDKVPYMNMLLDWIEQYRMDSLETWAVQEGQRERN